MSVHSVPLFAGGGNIGSSYACSGTNGVAVVDNYEHLSFLVVNALSGILSVFFLLWLSDKSAYVMQFYVHNYHREHFNVRPLPRAYPLDINELALRTRGRFLRKITFGAEVASKV